MARPLTFNLDQIAIGNTAKRSPAWKVVVWDIRAGLNTISQVVSGLPLDPVTGPKDITEFVEVIGVQEKGGDYITGGIPSVIINGVVQDPDGQFDPSLIIPLVVGTQAYTDNTGRFFRRGNLIRITLGDERVPVNEWVDSFTGKLATQVGYERGRNPHVSQLRFKAYGREATFTKFERTSKEFTPTITYREVLVDIATFEMGLAAAEIDFATGILTNPLRHKTLTMAKENPMALLSKLLFVGGFLPKFNGSGKLTQTSGIITSSSDRTYSTDDGIISISQPLSEIQPPDAVCIIGIDFELTRINQPRQVIATMNITTGYFTSDEDIELYWSGDRTKLADNVTAVVLKSVNGGLSILGGGETFVKIDSPSTSKVGTIGMRVTISTGYAPYLAIYFLVEYIAFSAFPDFGLPFGGPDIKVGSIIAAIFLSGALLIMSKLGRGQYKFEGDPFEYVYKEIRRCAVVKGSSEFDRIEVEVKNHLIDNETLAMSIATDQLIRQSARGRPRSVRMSHDLALEPDDVFRSATTNRRFLVDSISYKLQRGSKTSIEADVKCFEVTDNISRAT